MLFDGASLVLYMCGVVVYISNIVKGLRTATMQAYGSGSYSEDVADNSVVRGVEDRLLNREDSLRVMAASNTILALILVGVLVLQAGQWYALRKEDEELADIKKHKSLGENVKKSGHSKKKSA